MLTRVGAIALLLLVSACDHEPAVRSFPPDAYPERLSEWGIVTASGNLLELGRDVLPYDLATPLFTDHAHKLRTVWMPPGARARYSATDVFDLPVGTILSKTFYYPRAEGLPSSGVEAVVQTEDTSGEFLEDVLNLGQVRLIATRLLVRQSDGWDALPYVWDEAQSDAFLRIAGALVPLQTADDGGHAFVIVGYDARGFRVLELVGRGLGRRRFRHPHLRRLARPRHGLLGGAARRRHRSARGGCRRPPYLQKI